MSNEMKVSANLCLKDLHTEQFILITLIHWFSKKKAVSPSDESVRRGKEDRKKESEKAEKVSHEQTLKTRTARKDTN